MLNRPDHRPAIEPIIALIDVVFFLLVFFMLIARLDATAPFDVIPPRSTTGQDMPGGGVTLSVGLDGAIAVNGNVATQSDWLQSVINARSRDDANLIRVNAHRDVPLRHVLPLIEALERAVIGEVILVVTPPAS